MLCAVPPVPFQAARASIQERVRLRVEQLNKKAAGQEAVAEEAPPKSEGKPYPRREAATLASPAAAVQAPANQPRSVKPKQPPAKSSAGGGIGSTLTIVLLLVALAFVLYMALRGPSNALVVR
jgi:hypothetical protein